MDRGWKQSKSLLGRFIENSAYVGIKILKDTVGLETISCDEETEQGCDTPTELYWQGTLDKAAFAWSLVTPVIIWGISGKIWFWLTIEWTIAKEWESILESGVKKSLKWLDNTPGVTQKAPWFIVGPKWTAYPVPKWAEGPVPNIINWKQTWIKFEGWNWWKNWQVDTMRIMDPTPQRWKSPWYPDWYIKYQNKAGKGVDPITWETLPDSKNHFPIN